MKARNNVALALAVAVTVLAAGAARGQPAGIDPQATAVLKYADLGGWSDLFTWQGAAGIGYAFRWGDVIFDYRYLYYSQSGQDKLIDNISFRGFALGANFRF